VSTSNFWQQIASQGGLQTGPAYFMQELSSLKLNLRCLGACKQR